MNRARLKNIINKSKGISDKKVVGDPFDLFVKTMPTELDYYKDSNNYRLREAWEAYGKPKDLREAYFEGLVDVDRNKLVMPSIGYNQETDTYEYLNKGKENDSVNKDIRVWENDTIPFVKELKNGGYIRTFDEEKNCWTYSKNKSQEDIESFKSGGKKKVKIYLEGDCKEGEYIEVNSLDEDNKAVLNQGGKQYGDIPGFQKGGKPEKKEEIDDNISLEDFINQKILERTEAAIKKATTRKTGYKFKNKYWKNCIATATDNYGVPICLRNVDFAADPKKYGFEELQFGDNLDTLPDGVLIQDYNKPNDYTTPGHTIMLVGRTETGAPIYSYSSGSSDPSDMHNSTTNYFFDKWDDKVKPRAYRYIGTPAERTAWEEEYRAMYPEVEAFKQGGQINVIAEGALHAHKNHMEGAGEDFTAKGVPVIDAQGNQTAEIEREELILNKENTDKIEDLYKKFFSEGISEKEKDELAIRAGKRLAKELIENTDDRVGLIEKEGGKI